MKNHGVHNGNKKEREVKALTIQERRKMLIMDYADRWGWGWLLAIDTNVGSVV